MAKLSVVWWPLVAHRKVPVAVSLLFKAMVVGRALLSRLLLLIAQMLILLLLPLKHGQPPDRVF